MLTGIIKRQMTKTDKSLLKQLIKETENLIQIFYQNIIDQHSRVKANYSTDFINFGKGQGLQYQKG